MKAGFFISGTDTDVGKSVVTLALALAFEKAGYKTGVFKPLQSGAYFENGTLQAPDLVLMQKFSKTLVCRYSYLLEGECSPALAAKLASVNISMDKIKADFADMQKSCDVVLAEGAGGLLCPVDFAGKSTMADVAKALGMPCLLVARPNLGTINHCLMTDRIAKNFGLDVRALIINRYPCAAEDVAVSHVFEELAVYTDTPLFAVPVLDRLTCENLCAVFEDKINGMIG